MTGKYGSYIGSYNELINIGIEHMLTDRQDLDLFKRQFKIRHDLRIASGMLNILHENGVLKNYSILHHGQKENFKRPYLRFH